MKHTHKIYDTDSHFSINPITRAIKNESSKKTTLMQYDHNSERFTFEIPKTVEGHDMNLCNRIEVHYINISSANPADTTEDVYIVDDMKIQTDAEKGDVVVFSWLISGNATNYAGNLSFLIRFKCLDGDTITYSWSTAIYSDIFIGSGMSNSEMVLEKYSDVLEAWKNEIMGASAAKSTYTEILTISGEENHWKNGYIKIKTPAVCYLELAIFNNVFGEADSSYLRLACSGHNPSHSILDSVGISEIYYYHNYGYECEWYIKWENSETTIVRAKDLFDDNISGVMAEWLTSYPTLPDGDELVKVEIPYASKTDLGNIDKALDNIIALQESILGGDA